MKLFECSQGSSRWLSLRMGRPTASQFSRIITPTGKPSSSADGYANELLAELMIGRPLDGVSMPWMREGSAREGTARQHYEFITDREVKQVGFCTTDDERVGASPDGLVGDDGLVEIKNPLAHTHVEYLLGSHGVDKAYLVQAQGQLYVTEREWTDIISYFPGLPYAIVRVKRDEEFIKKLELELEAFLGIFDARLEKLQARGWIKEPVAIKEWLTQSDVDAIIAQRFPPGADTPSAAG